MLQAVSIRKPQLHCMCVRVSVLSSPNPGSGTQGSQKQQCWRAEYLILGRSGAGNHSCCEPMRALFLSCSEESLAPVLPDLWLLQFFHPLFFSVSWAQEGGVPLMAEHSTDTHLCPWTSGKPELTAILCTKTVLI